MAAPPVQMLNELFGSYKAEWLRERIFDLFTTPSYFPQLEDARPCILFGGRGSGKTTVLRSLSYEGRYVLTGRNDADVENWSYYGLYYRVDTNRVTAFKGDELRPETWSRIFGHYVNLLLCGQVLKFLSWYEGKTNRKLALSSAACARVALSLHIPGSSKDLPELRDGLESARVQFEAFVNNLQEGALPSLSIQGGPIQELLNSLCELAEFKGKSFFFLIDEYENLLDDQQVILNTLIKHSGSQHTFKVGVRELGWRVRHTANSAEQLISPADYVRIDIGEKLKGRFDQFARDIVTQRFAKIPSKEPIDIVNVLPALTDEEEAIRLGVEARNREYFARIENEEIRARMTETLTPLQQFFVFEWTGGDQLQVRDNLMEFEADRHKWITRFDNYRHSLLFTIRTGKSGIRKFYCGWETFVRLSGDNIRYLLELVDQTVLANVESGKQLWEPVDYEVQTKAAQSVGRKNVLELEGLSIHGADLTRLVLGLGRIFQVMANEAKGHAPEVNQFHLAADSEVSADAAVLIRAAIMHLALVRTTANKLADERELKDYDYSLHPIFTPFFVFSHRRKRKMILAPERLVGLVKQPTPTIRSILRASDRDPSSDMPEQLQLFGSYYGR